MHTRVIWTAETPDHFAATTGVAGTRAHIFLVAEALTDGTWDWVTWSRLGRHSSLHGHAATREAAMRKAELAARAIGRTLTDMAA